MNTTLMARNAAIGGSLWIALAAASFFRVLHWGVIELLFLLGPLVIVPLGLQLGMRLGAIGSGNRGGNFDSWIQLPAALLVAVSFWRAPGVVAAALVAPWGLFATYLALRQLLSFFHEPRGLKSFCTAMSLLYLPVGCAWLAASRYGLSPMGFQEPIVLLTAVHFHFAGFAAPRLAAAVATPLEKAAAPVRSLFAIVVTGVLAGPGLLAAGFVIGPRLKLAAALIIACGEFALASFFLFAVGAVRSRLAQLFIALSAASVMAAMVLAVIWALGEFPLQPFVHLDEMARLHGTANALGFTTCGLLGWTLAARERNSTHAAT